LRVIRRSRSSHSTYRVSSTDRVHALRFISTSATRTNVLSLSLQRLGLLRVRDSPHSSHSLSPLPPSAAMRALRLAKHKQERTQLPHFAVDFVSHFLGKSARLFVCALVTFICVLL
jgi:hypothetical protein